MQPTSDWGPPPQWPGDAPPAAPAQQDASAKPPGSWLLAAALFVVVFFTSTTLGADWVLRAHTDVMSPIPQVPYIGAVLSPEVVRMVWTDPALFRIGLSFSLPMMLILLCHELGHYLVCRRYRIAATPPYFLPAPFAIGTFGAFIRIRSPIRDRRQLFDIGVAGPIAGFLVLVPILVYGIAHSVPTAIERPSPADLARPILPGIETPGASLLSWIVTHIVHGELPPDTVLNLHPFVLASWVGLLATSLNLLPLSQLDGGHILYAVVGKLQWKLATPLWLVFLLSGFLFPGWWLWAAIVRLIGLRHPPVADESVGIGPGRCAVALFGLLMLVLCFMPVPLETTLLAP